MWKAALGILGAALLIAWIMGGRYEAGDETMRDRISERLFSPSTESGAGNDLPSIALDEYYKLVDDRATTAWEALEAIPVLANTLPEKEWPGIRELLASRYDEGLADLAVDFRNAIVGSEAEAVSRIEKLANGEPPLRWANRVLGELALRENLKREAAGYYLREGSFPDAEAERVIAVNLYHEIRDYQKLDSLRSDPRFAAAMSPRLKLDLAIRERDWLGVAEYQLQHTLASVRLDFVVLALIGGCVWGVILLQFGQFGTRSFGSIGLCLAAFVLGAISTFPTIYLDIVVGELVDLEPNGDFLHDFAVSIADVGLREEFCKALLFLPLVPILARRANELEMLIVAGFVGLGFAVEENTVYFEMTQGLAGPARLLTANFFHIGLTGLTGLYLCRAVSIRGYSFSHFFYVFGIVVFAHGAYDALLSQSQMGDLSLFAYTVYIVLSLRFFAEAHELREPSHSAFSITGTFTVGLSLFIGCVLVYLSWRMGLKAAVAQLVPSLLGVGIVAFMFFREFREELYE